MKILLVGFFLMAFALLQAQGDGTCPCIFFEIAKDEQVDIANVTSGTTKK